MKLIKGTQTLELSDLGGTILRWRDGERDLFYPHHMIQVGDNTEPRGGMFACFPNFSIPDSSFGLPLHGTLQHEYGSFEHISESECRITFEGSHLTGANAQPVQVETHIKMHDMGFTYTLTARLMDNATQPVFINLGLHPYFPTPQEK